MATSTSLQIVATDNNGKKVTTTVTYVNPEASNEKLKTFAQMLNELTNNIYESTTKITKEDIL